MPLTASLIRYRHYGHLLLATIFFKVAISKQKIGGVIIGFAGALVLVLGKRGASFQVDILYSFLPVIATFCYGMSTNITKQKLQNESPLYTTSMAMAMIGVPALVGLMLTNAPHKIIQGQAWVSLGSVAILAIFGTLIAWMLFYRLVQRTDALFAASVTYLIPIVAMAWGFSDGESLSPIQIAGFALIMVGVYYTTRTTVLAKVPQ